MNNKHLDMIGLVAQALGADLLDEMAFVGGSTTGLLITDSFTLESIRYTDDVDLVVSVVGLTGWYKLQKTLQRHGFKIAMNEEVNCRMQLGELKVDFMPDDESILGYSNRWYTPALNNTVDFELDSGLVIKLVAPPYFLATKFEAYKGRGANNLLSSRDMEDILNLIDGREALLDEIATAPVELIQYLKGEFRALLGNADFQYLVQSTTRNDSARAALILERIQTIVNMDVNED